MRKSFVMVAALLIIAAASQASLATIVNGVVTGGSSFTAGDTFVKLIPPLSNPFGPANSVGNDNFQSNNLYGFDESQNILLTAPLLVDVGSTIPTGTIVASHYVFYDPRNASNIIGNVNFDSAILGIITSTTKLAASDHLANTGVNYLNPGARGLESGDSVTISGPNQIHWSTSASSPGDYVRVITAVSPGAVPEPSTILSAIAGLAFVGYRKLLRHRLT